jgi:hypothetical protein
VNDIIVIWGWGTTFPPKEGVIGETLVSPNIYLSNKDLKQIIKGRYILLFKKMDKSIVATNASSESNYRLPENTTMQHAIKLAIVEDKPIMMDYWTNSLEKSVLIGVKDDETKEKILVRSEEEYTSPISKIYKVGSEYIIMTENSIYIVDVNIPTKRISA